MMLNPPFGLMDTMNPEQVGNNPSGRIIQIGAGEITYWAFLPNALPPDLTFDADLVQRLSSADRALGGLAGLGRTITNPHLLIRPFVVKKLCSPHASKALRPISPISMPMRQVSCSA